MDMGSAIYVCPSPFPGNISMAPSVGLSPRLNATLWFKYILEKTTLLCPGLADSGFDRGYATCSQITKKPRGPGIQSW